MDALYKFTYLGRPIDPRYPSNIAIVILSVLGAIVSFVVEQTPIGGLTVLITWILGRELDPDNQASAFLSAGLAYATSFFIETPDFLVLFGVVMLLRVVNRSVGPPAKLTDTLTVLALTTLIIFTGNWMIGLVAIVAFLLDSNLQNPHPFHTMGAIAVAGIMGVYFLLNGIGSMESLSRDYTALELGITSLFILAIVNVRDVRAKADYTNEPLALHRIQAAMGLGLMAGLVMIWHGDTGFIAMAPLWATMLGIALYRLLIPTFIFRRR